MDRAEQKALSTSIALRLADLGPVEVKNMFGGWSLRLDAVTFAFTSSEGDFYWRTDEQSLQDWLNAGAEKFIYTHKNTGKVTPMPYYKLPELPEDQDALVTWGRKALEAARRQKKAPKTKK